MGGYFSRFSSLLTLLCYRVGIFAHALFNSFIDVLMRLTFSRVNSKQVNINICICIYIYKNRNHSKNFDSGIEVYKYILTFLV